MKPRYIVTLITEDLDAAKRIAAAARILKGAPLATPRDYELLNESLAKVDAVSWKEEKYSDQSNH